MNEKLIEIEETNDKIARELYRLLQHKYISKKSLNDIYELAELQAEQIADYIDEVKRK